MPLTIPGNESPEIRRGEGRFFGLLTLVLLGGPMLGVVVLTSSHPYWLPPLREMGPGAVVLFVPLAGLMAGLCMIPTHAASLVSGMLFGAVLGSLWAIIAVSGAAVLGYLILGAFVGDRASALIERNPGAAAVRQALLRSGWLRAVGIIALVRLSPLMPFGGTNLLVVAGGGRLPEFVVGSVLGMFPRIVAVAMAGAGLAVLDFDRPVDVWFAVLGGLATVAALVIIGRIARLALRRVSRDLKGGSTSDAVDE